MPIHKVRQKRLSNLCKLIRKFVDGEEVIITDVQETLNLSTREEAWHYIDIIGYHFPIYERNKKRKTGKVGRDLTIFKMLEPENRPNG